MRIKEKMRGFDGSAFGAQFAKTSKAVEPIDEYSGYLEYQGRRPSPRLREAVLRTFLSLGGA